jgi:primosomal protein N' (replication factor Y)
LLIRVAVPVPQLDLLTYHAPDQDPVPVVGARALVPLGTRTVTGIVVEVVSEAGHAGDPGVRSIHRLLDAEAFIPPHVVELARWTAGYYAAGVGDAITSLLPPMTRSGRPSGHKMQRIVSLTVAGREMAGETRDADGGRPLTSGQRRALDVIGSAPEGMSVAALTAEGVGAASISRLSARALVSVRMERVDRDPFEAAGTTVAPIDPNRRLTLEQSAAFDRLQRLAAEPFFRVALLHGVTGSGKTEVFLRLSAFVRASGRTVLMLVPEIALTPIIAAQFRQAFGAGVAILHSGLSDGERHDEWQRIRRGDVGVVVGTRSAVFAPLDRIGLIVVDEEHDASYKQEESPRYHGRDVAIVRGQREAALVVLASATPSMESYQNALSGRYERVVLARRVADRPLPAVTIVDMREEYAQQGPDVVLGRALSEAIDARLARGEQALVLLNRRGLATSVFCRQCAATLDCPNCSVSLVVHGEGTIRRARCHYCNYSVRVPTACPLCAGPYLEQAGFGTERVEAELRRGWPQARVARLDRDAIRRKGALASLLARFRAGEIDVLVGTQMIAKGHDFPRVTLVGVVSADVGLGMADFRAAERTFQLLTQVAGRAGRGEQPGEAIVQTIYPEHYSIQLACLQDFGAFYERESHFRRAMRYPPSVSLINVIVRARMFSTAMEDASDLAIRVRKAGGNLRVLGPAPAPLNKLRGEYRAQLLVKGVQRTQMRETVIAAIAARPELARRTIIDVDPLSML